MKLHILTALSASACALSLFAAAPTFAQSTDNRPLTRAEVKAELAALRSVGYDPMANDLYYPNNIQAAEARLNARRAMAQPGN